MPRKRVHVRNYQRKNGPVKEHDRGMETNPNLQAAIAEARSPSLEWALSEIEKNPDMFEAAVYLYHNVADPLGISTVDELVEAAYSEGAELGGEMTYYAEIALPLFPHIHDAMGFMEDRPKQYEILGMLEEMRKMTQENPDKHMYVVGDQFMPVTIVVTDIEIPGQDKLENY